MPAHNVLPWKNTSKNDQFTTVRVPRTCPKSSDWSLFESDGRKLRESCKRGMVTTPPSFFFFFYCLWLYLLFVVTNCMLHHKLQLQLLVTGFYYFHILGERTRCERIELNNPLAPAGMARSAVQRGRLAQ